jgi:hypothetical protein
MSNLATQYAIIEINFVNLMESSFKEKIDGCWEDGFGQASSRAGLFKPIIQ